MPNVENIRLWVDALRSGDYAQGTGVLRNAYTDRWCCLGVACDVARKNGLDLPVSVNEMTQHNGYDGEYSYLPQKVMDWLGIDARNPRLGAHMATDLNDNLGASFYLIADAIENRYLREETA